MARQPVSAIRQRVLKTLRIWLAVYPAALVFYCLFGKALADWPLPLRLLLSSVTVVTFVSNIGEPAVVRIGRWIANRLQRPTPSEHGQSK